MENTIKMANRYGLNLKLTNIKDETDTAVIDFANEVSLEISGEITWATGGQGHVKMIGFKDPKEGTLKISTQVTTMQVMQLLAGGKLTDKGNKVSFKDDGKIAFKYYKIEGDTVWKDEEGVVYNEKVTVYKALVKPNYNVTYNGSGDPTSIDIEFELAVDKEGNFAVRFVNLVGWTILNEAKDIVGVVVVEHDVAVSILTDVNRIYCGL